MHGDVRGRRGEGEAGSSMNREPKIKTWAEARRLMDWATQASLFWLFSSLLHKPTRMGSSCQAAFRFFLKESDQLPLLSLRPSIPPDSIWEPDDGEELSVYSPDFCFLLFLLCVSLIPLNLLMWIFSYNNLEMFTSLLSCWIISSIVSESSSSSLIIFIWRVRFLSLRGEMPACVY